MKNHDNRPLIIPKQREHAQNDQDKLRGFRPQTAGLVEMLSKVPKEAIEEALEKIKTKEAKEQRVIVTETDGEKVLYIEGPSYTDRADVIFLSALQDGLKKGVLAKEFLNISANRFSMIRNPNNANKPNVDLVIIAALVSLKPFSLEEVNHVLMEIELPGLFFNTYDDDLNKRNYVLAEILKYAQGRECPRERWIFFAREILEYLEMPPLQDLPAGKYNLSTEEEALAMRWMAEAERNCVKTNYMILRNDFIDRFEKENNLSDSKVVSYLAQICYSNNSTIRDVFTSDFAGPGTHGSRETIIQGAVHMGCSLDETNALLREANYALLYPFRPDNTDAVSIAKLLRNEFAREERNKELQEEQERLQKSN